MDDTKIHVLGRISDVCGMMPVVMMIPPVVEVSEELWRLENGYDPRITHEGLENIRTRPGFFLCMYCW